MKTVTIKLQEFKSKKIPTTILNFIKEEDDKNMVIESIKANNKVILNTLVFDAVDDLKIHLNEAFEPLGFKCSNSMDSTSGMYFYLNSEGAFRGDGIMFSVDVGETFNKVGIHEFNTKIKIRCRTEFKYYDELGFNFETFTDANTLMEKHPKVFKKLYKK